MAHTVENPLAMRETQVRSLSWEDPLRRERQPTPVILPGKSHGQRSLAGYRPWARKELDTTERLSLSLGNGRKANHGSVCWFLWYKYSHYYGRFPDTKVEAIGL